MQAEDPGEIPDHAGKPLIGREEFARISEVEGISLGEDARRLFVEFDRRKLSAEERRRLLEERGFFNQA